MSNNSFADYITDLLSPFGSIKAKATFEGYGVYCNNLIFVIIVNDDLYFKADKILAKVFENQESNPFTYEARGKKVSMSYYKVPIEAIEDEEQLKIWFEQSLSVAKKKKTRKIL